MNDKNEKAESKVRWNIGKTVGLLFIWIIFFFLAGILSKNVSYWSMMLIGAAVITYFSVLSLPKGVTKDGRYTESRIRLSITSCLLVLYIVFFGSIVYSGENIPENAIATDLLPTLTNLLTVTVSFFFGSTAAVEVAGIMKPGTNGLEEPNKKNESDE